MGLTMHEKKAVTRETAQRYQRARKKQKGQILREFTALTGYHRTYASWLLRNTGRKVFLSVGSRSVIVVGAQRKEVRRQRRKIYDDKVFDVLRRLWKISDYLCGKRLVVFIRETLPSLERFGELRLDDDTRAKLMRISPASIDRLLRAEKKKFMLRKHLYKCSSSQVL